MPAVAGFTILCLILSIIDAFMGETGIFSLLFIAPQIPASILMGQYLKENTSETRSKLATGFCLQSFAALVALGVHTTSYIKKHPDVYNAETDILSTEDAAEMHGQTYKNKPCGSFGEISTFSFYSNKFISCGEGGIVTTNSLEIKKKVDSLKNLSFGKKNRFEHSELGYNFRMSNLQAAVAYAQIKGLKKIIKKKREIGKIYNNFFKDNISLKILPFKNNYSKNIYWVYGIIVKKNYKKKLVKHLNSKNIETRDFFFGMHRQPILKKMKIDNKKEKFPNSDYLQNNGIYIPSGPDISYKQIKYVADTINNFFKT